MAAPLFAPRQPREKPSGLALRQGIAQTVPLARSELPAAEPFAGLCGARPGGTAPPGLLLRPFPGAERGRARSVLCEHTELRVSVVTGHGPACPLRERTGTAGSWQGCCKPPCRWKKPVGPVPMDAILNCNPEELEDYYNLLGCDELSTVEQILAEYKIKALECHPDKHPGNPKAVENFQRLQQAKETLTNEESRARYDHWRRSKSMHWAVQGKKDQMLEAPDFGNINNTTKEMWMGNNGDGPLEGSREQEDVAIPDVKPQSAEDPDSPRFSEGNYWHLRFRWSGDAPSDLLRKFRNYEI
ncbi:dnaJ homolog subfamily C member 12 isoform X2 [Prinia subflava]|uniref:dnaJ homolog subfamily C member 12 isoform X2 n=1 Tax=Prinia subflava TaxID=208062 RepID=UPI002FE0B57E